MMVLRVTTHLKPFKQPGFTGELSRYKWLFGGFSPPKSDKSSDLNLIYASNYTLCGPKNGQRSNIINTVLISTLSVDGLKKDFYTLELELLRMFIWCDWLRRLSSYIIFMLTFECIVYIQYYIILNSRTIIVSKTFSNAHTASHYEPVLYKNNSYS